MASYSVKQWVQNTRSNPPDYLPGLYVLEKDGLNVTQDFLLNTQNDQWLTQYYEDNKEDISQTLPKGCTCEEWGKEVKEQVRETLETLIANARIGRQLGHSQGKTSFVCFYSTKQKPQYRPTSQLVKFYSIPSSKRYISYIRIYGLQYGNDLVLITGIEFKVKRTNQESREIMKIVATTEKILNAIPNLKFFNNRNISIEL